MACQKLINVLVLIIIHMANMSFESGRFQKSQKQAVVRPQLKKPNIDLIDLKSYHPVSNLSFVSKIIERLAANKFNVHSGLFNLLQRDNQHTGSFIQWRLQSL